MTNHSQNQSTVVALVDISDFDIPLIEKYLPLVPLAIQKQVLAYPLIHEQWRSLIAKLLLKKLLIEHGYSSALLENYQVDEFGKPTIHPEISFSISHAHDYIVCVLSSEKHIGIDIEKMRPICIDDYSISLSDDELKQLEESANATTDFFHLWTKKEAISKANGKGLVILLPDMIINKNNATCNQQTWHLQELSINADYVCHVASENKLTLNTKKILVEELLMNSA